MQENVLEDTPRRLVKQHVVRDDGRHPEALCQVVQFVDPHLVVGPPAQCQRQVGPLSEDVAQTAKPQRAGIVGRVRDKHGDQPVRPVDQVFESKDTFRLAAALFTNGQQPAKPAQVNSIVREFF